MYTDGDISLRENHFSIQYHQHGFLSPWSFLGNGLLLILHYMFWTCSTSRLALPWLQLIMSTVASSMSFGFPGYRQQCFITGLANIYVLHVTCNLYFCILWFLNVRCWKINVLLLLPLRYMIYHALTRTQSVHDAHVSNFHGNPAPSTYAWLGISWSVFICNQH